MGTDPSEGLWAPSLQLFKRRLARRLLGMGAEIHPTLPLAYRTEK